MHPYDGADLADADRVVDDSAYTCALALFRRVEEPLDGVHPALATLLLRNSKRDEDLNARMTELADCAAAWQAREDHFGRQAADLRRDLDVALAHAAAAERAAHGMRLDVLRAERRYTARCASALSDVGAMSSVAAVRPAQAGRTSSPTPDRPWDALQRRHRMTA